MKIRHKSPAKWTALFLCILVLTLVLVACGNTGGDTTTPLPTPTPTPTGTVYTGTGFTLAYPQGWKVYVEGETLGRYYEFARTNPTDAPTTDPGFNVIVTAPAAGNPDQVNQAIAAVLDIFKGRVSNYQQDNTVSSTVTVGGDTWKQSGATGTVQGQQVKAIVLADYHAANQRLYIITLNSSAATFDQENTNHFQAVLQSFKFA